MLFYSNHYHYVTRFPCISSADAQANDDTNASMADLVYIYWDEFPSVAESPNEPPTAVGASATHGND